VTRTLRAFKDFVEANPYTGTADQVITLSLGLAEAAEQLDSNTYIHYRKETGINEKILSKLKVIGRTLLKIEEKKRNDVIKRLPASYSTIHKLCALKPEELVTATKSGVVTPSLSSRDADTYVKQVRFPRQFLQGDKGRWGAKEEHLYSVLRPKETEVGGEALLKFEKALRRLCGEYGLGVRKAGETSGETLRRQERAEREVFWRGVLEKELTDRWFEETEDDLLKQFNLRTRDELVEAPLRSFTGFLIKASGGRDAFWEKHGQAYVAKIHLLQEKTEDNAQRYNLKRRLEEIFAMRAPLAIWRNIVTKENGFIY
jgi:hypothetical protein